MKNAALQTILILGLGFLAHQFFPFWVIAIVAGITGLLFKNQHAGVSYAAGFAAASLLWGGYAAFLNFGNAGSLSGKMGEVFPIGSSYLSWTTGAIGGLLGGFGAMTGTLARKMFERTPEVKEA